MKHELCSPRYMEYLLYSIMRIYGILKSLHFIWYTGLPGHMEVAMIPLSALSLRCFAGFPFKRGDHIGYSGRHGLQ